MTQETVPGRWFRVVAPDGSVWCETSKRTEALEAMRPGDRLEREYITYEWRTELPPKKYPDDGQPLESPIPPEFYNPA